MSWSVTIPGVPPSTNHLYLRVRGNWSKMTKAPGVEAYQIDVKMLVRNARPSGWVAPAMFQVALDFYLKRDADCDNLLKALLDGVAYGLEIDDRRILPCVRSKTFGKGVEPRTVLQIDV